MEKNNNNTNEDVGYVYIAINQGLIADPTLGVEYTLEYEIDPNGLIHRYEDEHGITIFPEIYGDEGKLLAKEIIRILKNAIQKVKECYSIED